MNTTRPTRVKKTTAKVSKDIPMMGVEVETQEKKEKYDPKEAIRKLVQVDAELAALKKQKADLEKPLKEFVKEHGEVETYTVIQGKRVPYKAMFTSRAANTIDKDALVKEVGLEAAWELSKVTQTDVNKVHGQILVDKCIIKGETKTFSCKQVK